MKPTWSWNTLSKLVIRCQGPSPEATQRAWAQLAGLFFPRPEVGEVLEYLGSGNMLNMFTVKFTLS